MKCVPPTRSALATRKGPWRDRPVNRRVVLGLILVGAVGCAKPAKDTTQPRAEGNEAPRAGAADDRDGRQPIAAPSPSAEYSSARQVSEASTERLAAMSADERAAQEEACHRIEPVVRLDGVTTVSVALAERIAEVGPECLVLPDATSISTEAMAFLAGGDHPEAAFAETLRFEALSELTPQTAAVLEAWRGQFLYLDGLETLSKDAAVHLANTDAAYISLNGLREVTPDAVAAFSAWEGTQLSLGLPNFDVEIGTALGKARAGTNSRGWRKCNVLSLRVPAVTAAALEPLPECSELVLRVPSLDRKAAAVVARIATSRLELPSLTRLDAPAAEAFQAFDGSVLTLDGLETLDARAAVALGRWKGSWISFAGLSELDPQAAAALSKMQVSDMTLGLERLDPEVSVHLAKLDAHARLQFPRLPQLTPKAARPFAGRPGHATFDGIVHLNEPTVRGLAYFGQHGGLYVTARDLEGVSAEAMATMRAINLRVGVATLTVSEAAALASSSGGELMLDELRSADEAVLRALAGSKAGALALGLTHLDAAGAKALTEFRGNALRLPALVQADDDAVRTLERWQGAKAGRTLSLPARDAL